MARGGKRPGAGRPKGSLTKKSQEIAIAAAAAGETPLEYMLRIMRDESVPALVRIDMAKAAAPYVHARLASTHLTASDGEGGPGIIVQILRFADAATGLVSTRPPSGPLIEHEPTP